MKKPLRNTLRGAKPNDRPGSARSKRLEKRVGRRPAFPSSRPFLKAGVFEFLLREAGRNREVIEALLSSIGVKPDGIFVILMITVRMGGGHGKRIASNLMGQVREATEAVFEGKPIKLHHQSQIHGNKTVLILQGSGGTLQEFKRQVEEVGREIKETLLLRYGMRASVASGRPTKEIWGLHRSFDEVSRSSAFVWVGRGTPVLWFDDLPSEGESYSYTVQVERDLIHGVMSGDRQKVKQILTALREENFEKRRLLSDLTRLFAFELYGTLAKLIGELPSQYRKPCLDELGRKIDQMESHTDVDDFFDVIDGMFRSLCEIFDEQKKSHNQTLLSRVMDYIHSSYRDVGLSLSGVASRFKISDAYLSQFIKEQTGDTFSSHLERLRIGHAEELIRKTDISLTEVASRVGYGCPITFRRAFFRQHQMSPRGYRKQARVGVLLSEEWWTEKHSKTRELIFAHTDLPGGPREKAARFFSEKVKEYTEGAYSVITYPSGVLGYDTKLLDLVAAGGVDFVVAGAAIYGKYLKEMSLLMSPFLVETLEQGWRLYDTSYWVGVWYDELESKGFKMLATWEAGFRCLATRFPVESPEDVRGLKMRVPPHPIHVTLWKYLGAEPISLEIKDISSALQRKIIDGLDNPIATIWTQKFYEEAKHITLTKHIYGPLPLSISMKTWEKISDENQKAISRAAKAAATYSRQLVREQEKQMLRDMEREGAIIHFPDLKTWQEAMSRALDAFKREYGPFLGLDALTHEGINRTVEPRRRMELSPQSNKQ